MPAEPAPRRAAAATGDERQIPEFRSVESIRRIGSNDCKPSGPSRQSPPSRDCGNLAVCPDLPSVWLRHPSLPPLTALVRTVAERFAPEARTKPARGYLLFRVAASATLLGDGPACVDAAADAELHLRESIRLRSFSARGQGNEGRSQGNEEQD